MRPDSKNQPEPIAAATTQAAAQTAATLQLALAAHQKGALAQAQELYQQVLQAQPRNFDVLHLLGVLACQAKNPARAVELIGQALTINPDVAEAHNNCGNAWRDLQQPEAAVQCFDKAIALKPNYAEAHYNRGHAFRDMKRHEAAVESFDRAIVLKPAFAEAHFHRGNALHDLKRTELALESYARAIALKPDPVTYYNQGTVLGDVGQAEAALKSFDEAIALKPDYAEAHYNRGNALLNLKQYEAALASYGRAIALKSDYAEAHYNQGVVLGNLRRPEASLKSYDRAIALKPDYVEAYNNRGNLLQNLKQYEAALASYDRAIALKPDCEFLYGTWLLAKMQVCDWSDAENQFARLAEKIESDEKASPPFPILSITSDPRLQRKATRRWIESLYPPGVELPDIPRHPRHDRIRLGYYSADFHDHATAYLMAELFERHDRSRFELFAFSFGPDRNDGMRTRLAAAFDRFIDVRNQSDRDAALLSRSLEVDIAVDLKGYTQDARPGIFSMKAAPLQVNYLGYPGTMAAQFIDYLIADPTLIPDASRQHYREKIAYLPDSYQVNDTQRRITDRKFSREELGLPAAGFVFCCFNNNYKITPDTFDGWMRILRKVDGSVLWLLEDNPEAASNLANETVRRGVNANRLIFAKRMPLPDHLARHRAADLFIDTLPYNAHTTASDALWAGLPVLTCTGEAFASRVAASLLNAIGLPELVTSTQEAYEAQAVLLATHPERLGQIRKKLADNRLNTALFDTQLFTRHIESAYLQMYERYQADLPPEHIFVQP